MRIYLFLVAILLATVTPLLAQKSIKGQVTDQNNDPLIGVNVQANLSSLGAITDANGVFELTISANDERLFFSYIGYITKELEVQSNTVTVSVVMEEDIELLETVEVLGFEGVVGQARRRAASIQDIPESVVTFTGEQIEAIGINNVESFAALVPNLSFNKSQNIGVNFITVRGIPQIRNGDSPVSFVVDGVTIPDANLLNQELYDLAMIEVVKGPQGTLYGKNAIGGAINILTAAPTNFFKNKIKLGIGNGGFYSTQAQFSGPLKKDKIYFRLAGSYKTMDGLLENITLNEKVDFYKDLSLRGQFKFDFNARFSATLTGQISDTEGGATYIGNAPAGPQLAANDFNYVIDGNVLGESTLKNTFGSLKLDYLFNKVKLQSITAYNKGDRWHAGELDFLPIDILRQEQLSDAETINQEFRLNSTESNARLNWDLGLFFQVSERDLITSAFADLGFFSQPPAPTGDLILTNFVESKPLSDYTNKFSTIAFFAFLDYQLTDKLTLSAGLRYDNDKIEQDNRNEQFIRDKSDQELQPKLSISYKGSENVLWYANYGRGYRSAGFNSTTTVLFDNEFNAETSNNYEFGLKSSFKENRVIFNFAGFYTAFNNQQQYAVALGITGLTLGSFNYPESRMYGFEGDFKWRTSKYLDVFASYGLNKSIIVDGGISGDTDRTVFNDNNTPFVPQTTASFGLQSTVPISDNLDFSSFISASNKGKIYWHENNLDVSDSFTLLDARIGISFKNKYEFFLWGRNITNERYYQEYGAGEINGNASGDGGWPGQPRTYGMDLVFKF